MQRSCMPLECTTNGWQGPQPWGEGAVCGSSQRMRETSMAPKRPWWDQPWLALTLILASMVPLLYPSIPPLVDLLGHMGRYRVELDIDHSPWLQQYYSYHWPAIGNLGVDLLVMPLGRLIGL